MNYRENIYINLGINGIAIILGIITFISKTFDFLTITIFFMSLVSLVYASVNVYTTIKKLKFGWDRFFNVSILNVMLAVVLIVLSGLVSFT